MIALGVHSILPFCLFLLSYTHLSRTVRRTDGYIVYLQPSISLNTNIGESIRTIHLVCPIGTRWVVPETIDPFAITSVEQYGAKGSVLTLDMTENNTEGRKIYRGLYECCPLSLGMMVPLSWVTRPSQPACCPCCPWYEKHRCMSEGTTRSDRALNTRDGDANQRCISVFLFTGTVDTQAVGLRIVPGEPMLLPCPTPFYTPNTHDAGFPLTVTHHFLRHGASNMTWFPFPNDNQVVEHTYDPRYGLCLHKSQFPRATLQLACHYRTTGQVRLVQLLWSPSPPTIPPDIHLRITSSSAPLIGPNLSMLGPADDSNQTVLYRALKGSSIWVHCRGSYSQARIVKYPPPKLCFLWMWSESKRVDMNQDNMDAPNSADGWQLNACPSIQNITEPHWVVYATNEMKLPAIRRPIVVGCQIRNPTRITPANSLRIHIIPVTSEVNRLFWFIVSHNQASIRVIQANRTEQDEQTNHTALLFVNAMSNTHAYITVIFRILFWAEHETFGWPTCQFNRSVPTGMIQPVRRVHNRWECEVKWYQPNQVKNVSLVIQYANITQSLVVYTSPSMNGTTPRVSGLHGNVRKPIQVTCTRSEQEQILMDLLKQNLNGNSFDVRFMWNIELLDGPMGTHTFSFTQNQSKLTLNLPDDASARSVLVQSVHSSEVISEFLQTDQTVPVRGPRIICARCRSVYNRQLMWVGSSECHPLADWSLVEWNWSNVAPAPKQLMLILRQSAMPLQSWTDTANNQASFYIFGSVSYELECVLSGGLSVNETKMVSPKLWPSIRRSGPGDLVRTPTIQQTWRLSPYARFFQLKIGLSGEPLTEEYVECHYESQSVKAQVKYFHSTNPVIVDLQATNTQITDEPAGSYINLYCRARGVPIPSIYFDISVPGLSQKKYSEWTMVRTCLAAERSNFSSIAHACNLTVWFEELKGAAQLRCRATNPQSTVVKIIPLDHLALFSTMNNTTKDRSDLAEARWIMSAGALIFLIAIVLAALSLYFYNRKRKNSQKIELKSTTNPLYSEHHQSVRYCPAVDSHSALCQELDTKIEPVRELVHLLGSVEQLSRWYIPRDCVRMTEVSLGQGRYGSVTQGLYTKTTSPPFAPVKIPVALKRASKELISRQCLSNEIQILPNLSNGTNITRMLGLIVGDRQDLSDTYLVLEYCEHRSLADFVSKHAHRLKASIHSQDSGVCDLNGTDNGINRSLRGPTSTDFATLPKSQQIELNSTYKLTHQALYELASGIANGVQFIAEHRIIHRDLATRNILVDANYTPRICDFGLAVQISCTDTENMKVDSYRITSTQKQLPFRILPLEALLEQTFYLASDVWELSLLLWQLFHLETKRPFCNVHNAEELTHKLQVHFRTIQCPAQPPAVLVRPRIVRDDLWYMMCRAWQEDPKQRPTAGDFYLLLKQILDEMRGDKANSEADPRQTQKNLQELNYITCVDSTSTDIVSD